MGYLVWSGLVWSGLIRVAFKFSAMHLSTVPTIVFRQPFQKHFSWNIRKRWWFCALSFVIMDLCECCWCILFPPAKRREEDRRRQMCFFSEQLCILGQRLTNPMSNMEDVGVSKILPTSCCHSPQSAQPANQLLITVFVFSKNWHSIHAELQNFNCETIHQLPVCAAPIHLRIPPSCPAWKIDLAIDQLASLYFVLVNSTICSADAVRHPMCQCREMCCTSLEHL